MTIRLNYSVPTLNIFNTFVTCLRVKDAPAKFTRVTQRTLKWFIHIHLNPIWHLVIHAALRKQT